MEQEQVKRWNFPYKLAMVPATSIIQLVQETAKDLVHLLQNPAPVSPFAHFGDKTSVALAKLADIFQQLKPQGSRAQAQSLLLTPKKASPRVMEGD